MEIVEHYIDYSPPMWVRNSVERLLGSMPPGHLLGLEAIVLTNSATQSKTKIGRLKRRKTSARECGGFYSHASRDSAPSITIIVDSTLGRRSGFLRIFAFFQDSIIGRVLYHEVGHHLDATVGSHARTGEAAADDWSMRLLTEHIRQTYPGTMHVVGIVGRFFGPSIVRYFQKGVKAVRPN